MNITERDRAHIHNFLKLCYILLILSGAYAIKIFIHPENCYELFIAPLQKGFIFESIFYAFVMLLSGNLLLKRLL